MSYCDRHRGFAQRDALAQRCLVCENAALKSRAEKAELDRDYNNALLMERTGAMCDWELRAEKAVEENKAMRAELCGLGNVTESEPSFHDVTATRCLRHATIPPTIMPPATQECGLCMREEGILVGRIENRPETAWLIESRFTLTPSWWTGTGWSKDSLLAVRFCRKQDAEAEMPQLPEFNTCFASEHQWGLRESEQFLADIQEGKRLLMDEVRREREAALPLGHECCPCPKFMVCGEHPDGTPGVHCSLCGQPRSAHEPKPSPKPGK